MSFLQNKILAHIVKKAPAIALAAFAGLAIASSAHALGMGDGTVSASDPGVSEAAAEAASNAADTAADTSASYSADTSATNDTSLGGSGADMGDCSCDSGTSTSTDTDTDTGNDTNDDSGPGDSDTGNTDTNDDSGPGDSDTGNTDTNDDSGPDTSDTGSTDTNDTGTTDTNDSDDHGSSSDESENRHTERVHLGVFTGRGLQEDLSHDEVFFMCDTAMAEYVVAHYGTASDLQIHHSQMTQADRYTDRVADFSYEYQADSKHRWRVFNRSANESMTITCGAPTDINLQNVTFWTRGQQTFDHYYVVDNGVKLLEYSDKQMKADIRDQHLGFNIPPGRNGS